MIEMALMLPLMLFVILGGLSLGLALFDRLELAHAAQQGADIGTEVRSCRVALSTAREVYGRRPDSESCKIRGHLLEVKLGEHQARIVPFWDLTVYVTERAVRR